MNRNQPDAGTERQQGRCESRRKISQEVVEEGCKLKTGLAEKLQTGIEVADVT